MELLPIPGTLGFFADSEGNIYDSALAKRNNYRNGDGYVTTNVLNDDGWETIGVHRLVCLAFHGLPKEGFDHVNHRDCDIENNRPLNLEWVSAEQNNIHAEIFRKDNHRQCILAINNEYWNYPSWYLNVWEASEKTVFSALEIWDAIKDNKSIEDPEYAELWHFSFLKQSDNIPKNLQKERIKERGEDGAIPERGVKLRDIDTKITIGFSSIADAARFFKVGTSAIHQAIPQRDVIRIFKKQYQVAYKGDEFPELMDEDIERAKNSGPRDVVAYNYSTDRFYIFGSAADFIRESKLSKKAVTVTLAKDEIRRIGDWVALYHGDDNYSRLVDYVKGSSPGIVVTEF